MMWIAIVLVCLSYVWLWRRNSKAKKLPPGPKGLPILGSLHKLGANPHRDFHQLAQKYGPIMYLRLGFVPTIVVSSPQVAELILKTHDLFFLGRPHNEAAKYISWEQKNLCFAEYVTHQN
uniref:4-hydroxyphenylacetaldehyde oxime monooxygenase n=1 Tax=Cajanus cajan TaxID=3821 RepID=A0A151UER6_CAJCA